MQIIADNPRQQSHFSHEELKGLVHELRELEARVSIALDAYHEASKKLEAVKYGLKQEKALAQLEGRLDGKNAEERESAARFYLAHLYLDLSAQEIVLADARHELDTLRLQYDTTVHVLNAFATASRLATPHQAA